LSSENTGIFNFAVLLITDIKEQQCVTEFLQSWGVITSIMYRRLGVQFGKNCMSHRRFYKLVGGLETHWKYTSCLVATKGTILAFSKKNNVGGFLGLSPILDCSFPFPKEPNRNLYCSVQQCAM
jgi:hypothetical protein